MHVCFFVNNTQGFYTCSDWSQMASVQIILQFAFSAPTTTSRFSSRKTFRVSQIFTMMNHSPAKSSLGRVSWFPCENFRGDNAKLAVVIPPSQQPRKCVFPHPCQHRSFAPPVDVKCYVLVVVICISLIASMVLCLFMCLLAMKFLSTIFH